MKNLIAAVAVLSLIAARPAFADAEEKPVDHSSPQSVAKEFTTAFGKKKFERGFQCLTMQSQQMMASVSLLVASFATAGDKAKQKELQELLDDHDLKENKAGEQIQAIKDTKKLAAIFGDLMAWAEKNVTKKPGEKRKSLTEQLGATTLKNFKIDGNRATADVYQDGKKKTRPADFRKNDGKWYVDLAASAKRKKAGPKR